MKQSTKKNRSRAQEWTETNRCAKLQKLVRYQRWTGGNEGSGKSCFLSLRVSKNRICWQTSLPAWSCRYLTNLRTTAVLCLTSRFRRKLATGCRSESVICLLTYLHLQSYKCVLHIATFKTHSTLHTKSDKYGTTQAFCCQQEASSTS